MLGDSGAGSAMVQGQNTDNIKSIELALNNGKMQT